MPTLRLLLFLSALLTGLTGLLPGVGPVGARQVEQAQSVAAAVAVAAVEQQVSAHRVAGPEFGVTAPLLHIAPAPIVDVRSRIERAHE